MRERMPWLQRVGFIYLLALGLLVTAPSPAQALDCPYAGPDRLITCFSWCDFDAGSCQQGCHPLPQEERDECFEDCNDAWVACENFCSEECGPGL